MINRLSHTAKSYRHVPAFVIDNIDSMYSLRRTLRIKQIDIAHACRCSRTSLHDYESGERIPPKKIYNKLAAFFDWEVWL